MSRKGEEEGLLSLSRESCRAVPLSGPAPALRPAGCGLTQRVGRPCGLTQRVGRPQEQEPYPYQARHRPPAADPGTLTKATTNSLKENNLESMKLNEKRGIRTPMTHRVSHLQWPCEPVRL